MAHRYSVVAARWDELRLLAHLGKSTPDDDYRLRELTPILRALTAELAIENVAAEGENYGPDAVRGITDWCGHLPVDLSCLLDETWHESADSWS